MGKFLESLGSIDGFDIIKIGKTRAKKDELFEEIEKYDSEIKDQVRNLVNESNGEVFAIVKKHRIKGIYLFKVEKKGEDTNLNHLKTLYTDEVPEEVREKYNKHIQSVTTDYVQYQQYDKVILEDKVVQASPEMSKKQRTMALVSGFIVGFVFGWIVFDEIYMGFIFGILFEPIVSGLRIVVRNKRGSKKEIQEESLEENEE